MVYCAQSPAAALLEILVHYEIDVRDLPVRYRLLKIVTPDDVIVEHVSLRELPADWPGRTEVTRPIGDAWLAKGSAAFLTVPSAVVPETLNVLVNPAHPDAKRLTITQVSDHAIDARRDEFLSTTGRISGLSSISGLLSDAPGRHAGSATFSRT